MTVTGCCRTSSGQHRNPKTPASGARVRFPRQVSRNATLACGTLRVPAAPLTSVACAVLLAVPTKIQRPWSFGGHGIITAQAGNLAAVDTLTLFWGSAPCPRPQKMQRKGLRRTPQQTTTRKLEQEPDMSEPEEGSANTRRRQPGREASTVQYSAFGLTGQEPTR